MSGLKVGKTGCPSRAYPILGRISGWKKVINMLSSLRRFDKSEIAKERLKIIEFYQKHGEKITKEAFGVDRKLVYVWGKKLKESGGKLFSLTPLSTRPGRTREMMTDPRIVEFIKKTREEHPRLGKEKIKPLLDDYCQEISIPSISESTIGKAIKRRKFFFQRSGRVYHDSSSKWAQKKTKKKKRLRIKHSPKHQDFGHIQSDTVERIIDRTKEYFYSAIDAKGKFASNRQWSGIPNRISFVLQWGKTP